MDIHIFRPLLKETFLKMVLSWFIFTLKWTIFCLLLSPAGTELLKLLNFVESFEVNKQIDGIIQNMIEVTNGKILFRDLRTVRKCLNYC